MNRKLLVLAGLFSLVMASACVVRGTVRTRTTQPSMVLVSDGVYVIEDYDEPVFYSDNYYWRYSGNVWYRSSYHTGGWVRWSNVPNRVYRIDRPHTYVHYRGNGQHRGNARPAARDHRTPARVQHQPRGNARPAARDHRAPAQPRGNARPATRDNRAPAKPVRGAKPKKKDGDRPEKRRH